MSSIIATTINVPPGFSRGEYVNYEHNNGCDRDIFAYDNEEVQKKKFKEILDEEIEHTDGYDDHTPYDEALNRGLFHCYDVQISKDTVPLNSKD